MATFSEFFLTQGTGVGNVNGGGPRLAADDGPIYTTANGEVLVGSPTLIRDDSGLLWGFGTAAEVQVGDWLCWDISGAKEYRMVTDATDIAIGLVTVHRACTAGAGKAVYVGGAWQTFAGAIANIGSNLTAANWPASTSPPRLNVKYESGAAYNESAAVLSGDFGTPSRSLPLDIEGFQATPGDLDWRSTNIRSVVGWVLNSSNMNLEDVSHKYVTFKNVDLRNSSSSGRLINVSYANWYNCVLRQLGTGPLVRGPFLYHYGTATRCLFTRLSGTSTDPLVTVRVSGRMTRCVVLGGSPASGNLNVGVNYGIDATIDECVVFGCGIGVVLDGVVYGSGLYRNLIIGNTSHGVLINGDGSVPAMMMKDNLIAHNGGYGIANGISGTPTVHLPNCVGNYLYGNTSGPVESTLIPLQDNTTLAADPFEDFANGDYRIKTTSEAYGVRHDLPSGADADASFLDAGAIQRLRTAGGGGGRRTRARVML